MSQNKTEQEFENYMEGNSSLSRDYHSASSEQAPGHLDAAILAASRRQVQSRPRYAFSPFASDWHVPLSLAAVLVLCVTVVITMQQENDVYLTTPTQYQPLSSGDSVEGNYSATSSETETLQSIDRADFPEEALEADFDNAIIIEPAASILAAPMKQKMESTGKLSERILKREMALPAMRSREVMSDMPMLNEPAADSYAPKPADISFSQEPMFKMDEQAIQKESMRLESNPQRTIILEKRNYGNSENKVGRMKSKKHAARNEISEVARSSALLSTGKFQQSAKQWLITIRQLWVDGYQEEAVQELALFYERYPDYPEDELIKSLDKRLLDALSIER